MRRFGRTSVVVEKAGNGHPSVESDLSHRSHKERREIDEKSPVVGGADAVVEPNAVVVKDGHAPVARPAVLCPRADVALADATEERVVDHVLAGGQPEPFPGELLRSRGGGGI